MKTIAKLFGFLAAAAVACGALTGEAASLNKEGEWTTKVIVKRGNAHTFWVDGLSPDTSVMSVDVEGSFKYKDEDGETDEDTIYASESTDVQDEAGNTTAIYTLLTPDDWDVDGAPKSVTFTVTVSGFYDESNSANNKFTFHDASGDSAYPDDYNQDTPEPAIPAGADADHPFSFLPKETSTPANTVTCGEVQKTLLAEYGNVFYLRSSGKLEAGRKYMFGLAGGGDTKMKLTVKGGSADLFERAKPFTNVWTDCSAAYEFIPDSSDMYYVELTGGGPNAFTFRHAVYPVRKPEEHSPVDLVANVASDEFSPGYLNNPKSGAYDGIIDDKLFKFTIPEKGDSFFFRTDGADSPLIMRLYDKNGVQKAENLTLGGGDNDVGLAWTSSAKNEVVYIGVCQQLDDEEEPSAGPVTLVAEKVSPEEPAEALYVVPSTSTELPFEAAGAVPSSERTLGRNAWRSTFTIAGRKDIPYNIKARLADGASDRGLTIAADIYQLVNGRKVVLAGGNDSIDPNSKNSALQFSPSANGTVYVDVYVADGEWGVGKGLEYGPYQVCAIAVGDYGVLKIDMQGAPESSMAWKIVKKNGSSVTGEVFYPAGSTAILGPGKYTVAAQEVKGFAKPDATKGFGEFEVEKGKVTETLYKYTDTADPLDDSPDTTATEPTTKKKYAPQKLDPKSGKPVTASRTLWEDDAADWFTLSAAAGSYYRFAFTEKTGAPKMAVYGPGGWKNAAELDPAFVNDPVSALQIHAAAKGTYYVKVFHDETNPTDSSYVLTTSTATPGLVKFAKTDVSAKDSAAYVDLSVSRSAKDGLVRVKYCTEGFQADKDDAYYYPTNGVLRWEDGDNKAKTIRVRLAPNSGWATNKVVKVVLSKFDESDEDFDRVNEYVAAFDVDKKDNVLDTATITIAATAKKAPGTIQVAGSAVPKKPVLSVTAGATIEVPFERVLGADGIVGVKVETVKGTANKLGETDFTPVTTNLVWEGGAADRQVVAVATKTVPGDYTAAKTFTLKLTALTGKASDAAQYDKPTLASATVTVNIMNDKFAASLDDYAKTITDAKDGYTVKAGKKETWVVLADGSFYAPNKGELVFTFKTTGKFTYRENDVDKTFTATAQQKTLTIKDASTFSVTGYDLDGKKVALRQGVKYSASFGIGGTLKANNLPAGLKLEQNKSTKEWTVAGVPSKAGIFQATVGDEAICYDVAAQGTSAGTFTGLATTFDTTNGVPTLSSVTITAALGGKLSASVNIAGKKYAFADTGYAYITGDPADTNVPAYVTAELALVQKVGSGADARTVTNLMYYTVMDVPETDAAGWRSEGEVEIQMAALPDAKGSGYQEDVWYFGKVYRDNSKSGKDGKAAWETAMSAWAGYYTVSLVAPDAMYGEPQGSGYVTMTLDAKGKAKLAGMLADGTSYSGSAMATLAGDGDEECVRVPLYAQKGQWVFGGWLSVRRDANGDPVATIDALDADIVWKSDDPASTRDGYEGFALYLQPVGGWYDTVSNLQRSYLESSLSVDLPTGEDALAEIMDALALAGDYAFAAQPSGQAVDLVGNTLSVAKQSLVKDSSKKFVDWEKSVNASNVKLSFKRATGVVSGTFDLWYDGTNSKGAREQKSITGLKHYGILTSVREDNGYLEADVLSSGFFLAPQTLTEKVGNKTVSRKWTGSYRFDIKATKVDVVWTDAEE